MSDELNKLYTSELIRRGLGDADYIGPYGITTPPKRKIGEIGQGILSGIEKIGNFTEFLTSPKVGLPKKITDNVVVPAYEYLMSPSEIAKQKAQEKNNSTTKSLPLDELFYSSDSFRDKEQKIAEDQGMRFDPVDLTEQIRDLTPSGPKLDRLAMDEEERKDATQRTEEFREKEAEIAAAQGKPELGGEALQKAAEAAEDAFAGGVQQYANDAGINIPTTPNMSKEEALEKYKQEFANATGIDISGKVDKSSALMAMGLSLMQNRAGKGFNVGRLLSSVGEAGEKALPALEKAKSEAKQARIAAGKYALQQIKSDEDASAAIAAEEKAFQRERYFKLLDIDADLKKEEIKAGAKVGEIKNVKVDKVINGLEVQRGRGVTGAIFAFPQDALRDSAGALRSINGALTTVNQMNELLEQIDSEESPTFTLISDTVNSALVGAGLVDAEVVFGDSKMGKREQVKVLQDSIITQFKRMLTQETGNGISKDDVLRVEKLLGKVDLLGNPQESIMRLNEIATLFKGKRKAVRGVLDELQDPDSYPTTGEYEKNMELFPSLVENSLEYSVLDNKGASLIDVKDK